MLADATLQGRPAREYIFTLAGMREGNGRSIDSDAFAATSSYIRMPQWMFMAAVTLVLTSGAGAVWWASALSTRVATLEQRLDQHWQKIETHTLQLGDNMTERIERRVEKELDDRDYIRVRRGARED